MNIILTKKIKIAAVSLLVVLLTSVFLYSYPTGYTGRTLKSSTLGCGSCHSFSTNVTGSVTGPDTVIAGQTVQFNITVTDPGRSKAGVDIAAKFGSLNPGAGSAHLKLLNSELTNLHTINMTNHTVTVPFNYTAPANPGIDTIYSTVTSGTSAWNWAPNKRVIIINPTGIIKNKIANEFLLEQNYPNPFNPITNISFEIPVSAFVTVKVFDILGNELLTIFNSSLESGRHEISWNAEKYSSGVYFYRLETKDFSAVKKMILVK